MKFDFRVDSLFRAKLSENSFCKSEGGVLIKNCKQCISSKTSSSSDSIIGVFDSVIGIDIVGLASSA